MKYTHMSRVDPAGLEFTQAQAREGGASRAGISHPFGAKHSEAAEGAGGNDPKHWPGAQAWGEVTRRSRQWQEAQKTVEKHPWDMDKALHHLRTHAKKNPEYKCAAYVRQAIEAGGIRLDLSLRTAGESAYGYGPSLEGGGFVAMAPGAEPQAGDVAVIQPAAGHKHGHMTMFDGRQCISDYKQEKGMYSGAAYRQEKTPYIIYRRPKADGSGL